MVLKLSVPFDPLCQWLIWMQEGYTTYGTYGTLQIADPVMHLNHLLHLNNLYRTYGILPAVETVWLT
jgi:hypothetical protein